MPKITTLTFPELKLATSDAHKLRGYFGNIFREHNTLLHNHLEGGKIHYAYPLVQYKVINEMPTIIGIEEGATLLIELFLKIQEIDINGIKYQLHTKDLQCHDSPAAYAQEMHRYRFETLYMALNQKNYARLSDLSPNERPAALNKILCNHLLAALKGMSIWLEPEQRIFVDAQLHQRSTNFKNQRMIAFTGSFATNLLLPPLIGIGKSVSRGYGAIRLIK